MAPKRFIDFLKWAEAYHQELHDYYETFSEEAQRSEVHTLLQYVARHEDILRHLIEEYEHNAPEEVLETWFKISPDLMAIKHPDAIGFRTDMTINEVIDLVLELDDSLIAIYKILVREAMTDDVKESLTNLLEEEEREEVQLLRTQLIG